MSSNIMTINRGDSTKFILQIEISSDIYYQLKGQDRVYFGIMYPHQKFEDAVIKKKYTVADFNFHNNSILIELSPQDTLNLDPGVYYYALKLWRFDPEKNINEVLTVINKTKFIIND